MKKPKNNTQQIVNARARFDYELGEELVVGLELTGRETKAARLGHVQLKGSYVAVKQNQLWLVNASFSIISTEKNERVISTDDKRILAHRRQIDQLIEDKKKGLTIIPTKLLTNGRYIKLVIALGRGKKNYDKRQAIKKRDLDRENKRATI